jgi:two-component system, chemotaxis family, protein-glutamate methylesterase/glutaminase
VSTHLVVIGASSGGIEALQTIVGGLSGDFPAPICIVMHTGPQSPGVLPEILDRAGPLTVVMGRNDDRLRPGRVYVAPPDHHLLVEPDRVCITKGPRENRFRPAIDPLFRSAAQVYGPAAIGVILTGNLDDGTAGLWTIKQLGGVAIIQDPAEAWYPSMPLSALNHVKADHVVRVAEIADLLARLTTVPTRAAEEKPVPEPVNVEVSIAKEQHPMDAGLEQLAEPSPYTCPDCHGVLLQLKEADRIRFRCHTGHAYSVLSLLTAIHEGIEESLWNSIRSLEEGALLMRHLAEHLATSADPSDIERLETASLAARKQADVVRGLASEVTSASIAKP